MPPDTNLDRAIYDLLSHQCPAMWLGFPIGAGNVFWVDGINGLDTNVGTRPDLPFLTITHALGECVADHNDYIIVLEHGAAGVEPAYPVPINIARVHLMGLGRRGPDQVIRIHGDGFTCFDVTGRDVEITGLGFDTVAAAAGGISASTDVFGGWVHHCHFAGSSLGQGLLYGIGRPGDQLPWWLIEDNIFSSPNGVGITDSSLLNNLVCTWIRRNIFTAPAGGAAPCILSGGVEHGAITDNYFYCPIIDAGIVGWAITLGGAPFGGGPITNNHAMQTGDGTGNNPYRDTTIGAIGAKGNGWGMNYSGQAVITPAAA